MTRGALPSFLVCLSLLAAAAHGDVSVKTWATQLSIPQVSPTHGLLSAVFATTARSETSNFSLVEAPQPFILTGAHEHRRRFIFFNVWLNKAECGQVGIIATGQMRCGLSYRVLCSELEGTWRMKNLTLVGQLKPRLHTGFSGYADFACSYNPFDPPGPCGLVSADATAEMDLMTGRVAVREAQPRPKVRFPKRADPIDGKSYLYEKARIVGSTKLRRRAPTRDRGARSVPTPAAERLLLEVPALPAGHAHAPDVRVDPNSVAAVSLGPKRSLVRVEFAPSGSLERVKALRGPQKEGQLLGESMELDQQGHGHRVVAYALFGSDSEGTRLLGSFTLIPRCCCGNVLCQ